ncbi:MAG: glycosyltransferase [Syntrophaceae bacterium]|jgi:hypothetical protein|nr:glycosyltransferase [Syntrophaceae bacterium]HQI97778.1 glycosyltransferase [Syntrophorhabdus sp.]
MKKVLFIYIVREGLGIASKAEKIEQGFRRAGCDLTVKSFIISEKKLPLLIQIIRLSFDVAYTLMKKKYDVVFVRNAYYFLFLFFLCWIMHVKIQLEINTKEKEEFLIQGQRLRAWINSISFFLACKSASRIHAVTYELLDHYKKMCPQASLVFNPNFVVDEEYIRIPPEKEGEKTNLVFLGSTNQPWQGLDVFIQKVIIGNSWLLENCRLHVIGEYGVNIKNLIERNSLQASIIMHGYLWGQAKREVMTKMHIGIGVFSLEVKSMLQATPIKIGEYLYAGLPVIIGYDDPRLPTDQRIPMWLRIDIHRESNLHHRVNEFIMAVRREPSIREAVHAYAKARMSVKHYIDKILE